MPEQATDIGFQIQGIRVTDFAVHEPNGLSQAVGFTIGLQQRYLADTENWVVEVQITLSEQPEQPALANLTVECQYRLTGYTDWLHTQPETNRPPGLLPTALAVTLNSISLSTVRGILFERLAGTPWQTAIFPIIDPLAFKIAE